MTKILIVEDNTDLRDLLDLGLRLFGFTTVTAKDGKEGLEKALSEKPDLIVMDLLMPVMDGWEATRRLRANPETKDIPIVVTTALFRDSDMKASVEAGCSGYIIKPFTLEELQVRIRQLLSERGGLSDD